MKRWLRRVALVGLLPWLAGTLAWTQENKAVPPIPDGQDEPVITLDYTGGFRAPDPPGFLRSPYLRVYPSGKVVTGQNSPEQPIREYQLTPDELASLKELFVERTFLALDSKAIADQINAIPDRMLIADAPVTEITLRTDGKRHTVGVYALGLAARELKAIPALQQLVVIEQRLKSLHCLAVLGKAEAQRLLERANDALRKEMGADAPMMKLTNLRWVNEFANRKQVVLVRDRQDNAGAVTVTIEVNPSGEVVTVASDRP